MATIEKISGKSGASYRITVSSGFDTQGKRIRHRTTYKPDPGMTDRQIQKAVQRAAADFERSIEQGYVLDTRQTFSEYADYVLDLGPEGGDGGGFLVAEGTPEQVAATEGSYTGRYLRSYLK